MAKKDVIAAQLTLCAIVWDVMKVEESETERLEREIIDYHILKLAVPEKKKMEDIRERYSCICRKLAAEGILESHALLVTEDVELAAYAGKPCKEETTEIFQGMGVVYYEREGNRKDIAADMIVQGFEEVGVQFLDRIHKRKNGLPWNILYTKRTCVREITLTDLDALYELYAQEGITDFTEPLYERPEEEEYTKNYIKYMYYYYGYGMWVVCDRDTGKVIGRAGIEHREEGNETLMELGYIIDRKYQGKGLATEVCQAIIEYATTELTIEQLHCFIHPQNKASIHVAEKLGFIRCDLPENQGRCQGKITWLHYTMQF